MRERRSVMNGVAAATYAAIFGTVAALGWRRPALAIAAVLLLDPFSFASYAGPTTLTLPKVALVALAVGLMIRRADLRVLARRDVRWTFVAVLAVALATALSITQADFPEAATRETFKALEYALTFAACAIAYDEDPRPEIVRLAVVAVVALVSVLALAQEFGGAPSALWVGGRAVARIAGPLEGPNQLSGFLQLLLPVLAVLAVRKSIGWSGIVALALGAVAEVLTFSRAGVASCAIGVVAALLAARVSSARSWTAAVLAPVALGAAAIAAVGGEISRFWSTASQLQHEGLGTRQQLWSAAWRLWTRHPLLGIGADNYEFELSRAGYPELHTHANSQLIQSAVDGGLPLLVAFLWATLQPILTLARSARRDPLIAGVFGALIGIALHQIVDDMTFFPKIGVMMWTLTGVAIALASRSAGEAARA